jgi:hypothetical protein
VAAADIGNPPVVGLVEPAKELAKITAERDRVLAGLPGRR